jgi:hypothetical protein
MFLPFRGRYRWRRWSGPWGRLLRGGKADKEAAFHGAMGHMWVSARRFWPSAAGTVVLNFSEGGKHNIKCVQLAEISWPRAVGRVTLVRRCWGEGQELRCRFRAVSVIYRRVLCHDSLPCAMRVCLGCVQALQGGLLLWLL